MSGRRARANRRAQVQARRYGESVHQHQDDVTYFEQYPQAAWRLRPVVRNEVPSASGVTHLLVLRPCPARNGYAQHWHALPLILPPDMDDAAAQDYAGWIVAHDSPPCWRNGS